MYASVPTSPHNVDRSLLFAGTSPREATPTRSNSQRQTLDRSSSLASHNSTSNVTLAPQDVVTRTMGHHEDARAAVETGGGGAGKIAGNSNSSSLGVSSRPPIFAEFYDGPGPAARNVGGGLAVRSAWL